MSLSDHRTQVNADQMGMLAVKFAVQSLTDDLQQHLSPFMADPPPPRFTTECLIFGLFPFDVVNVNTGHPRVEAVREAVITHSLDIANADDTLPGWRNLTDAEWRALVVDRFVEYSSCFATDRQDNSHTAKSSELGPAMFRLGSAAAGRILRQNTHHPMPVGQLAIWFSANLKCASALFNQFLLR